MPKAIPSLEQRHVCQKTRVRSTKVMRTRSGSMVISHTTREKRSLGSIVANSGQTRTKQHLLNRYLPLNAAYHVLGFTNTFKWPTHLMGTWPAVGDARPNATGGWHCTRQRFSHNKALHDDYMATRVDGGVQVTPVLCLGRVSRCFSWRRPLRTPTKKHTHTKSRRRLSLASYTDPQRLRSNHKGYKA